MLCCQEPSHTSGDLLLKEEEDSGYWESLLVEPVQGRARLPLPGQEVRACTMLPSGATLRACSVGRHGKASTRTQFRAEGGPVEKGWAPRQHAELRGTGLSRS